MMITDDLLLEQLFRFQVRPGKKAKRSSIRHPVTPAKLWQRCVTKVRYVRPMERGAKLSAVRSHLRYVEHKDREHHDDKLICTLGDPSIIKEWERIQAHCRLIIAPERGDVLDMERLAEMTCREVFGGIKYAGGVHERRQSNGRLNRHIHLIFKEMIGDGASTLKRLFREAAKREATLQFEDNGLRNIRDNIDKSLASEARHLEKELRVGDHDLRK